MGMADKPVARRESTLRSRWPLNAALALFLLLLGISFVGQIASGRVLLPEDAAYQRLMVAKNLAAHFSWSINPGEFTSAFGTLLWPVLLAPFFLVLGATTLVPWEINAVLSIVLIVRADRIVREHIAAPIAQAALLLLLVVALPLGVLSASGMEQVLFLLLLLIFVELWARRMEAAERAGILPLTAAAVLLAATRYEGMLLVALAALLLLARKDFRAGLIVPIAAAVPLALYGVFSWRAGWLPVPASVYLRRAELIPSNLSQLPSVLFRSVDVLGVRPDMRAIVLLVTLLPAWLGITGRLESFRERAFFAPALALLAAIAHLTLIGDREIRYDAWLVLLAGWAILPALEKIIPEDLSLLRKNTVALFAGGVLAVLLCFPLLNRGVQGIFLFGDAMNLEKGIYQTAARWSTQCVSDPVATDAPGTIAFLTGRPVVDLTGFVSLGAFRVRRTGNISAEWMKAETDRRSTTAALIFQPLLQAQAGTIWQRIGGWRPAGCPLCSAVEIYAVRDDPALSACTVEFMGNLPADEILPLPAEADGP
jgi:hypothetical protein